MNKWEKMHVEPTPELLEALLTVRFRRAKPWQQENPDGEYIEGVWQPSSSERQPCCASVDPEVTGPDSLAIHCTSLDHVAALRGVDRDQLIAAYGRPELHVLAVIRAKSGRIHDREWYLLLAPWAEVQLERVQLTKEEQAEILTLPKPDARMAVIRSMGAAEPTIEPQKKNARSRSS